MIEKATIIETIAYPETADIESSSDEYANRFAGSVGEWMLRVQGAIVLQFLSELPEASVLDVGGGHGQLAIPLCHERYNVTVLSSDARCKKRISRIVELGACRFVVGNVIDLPFEDQSFDVVISFRMVTHCRQWPRLIGELCRVARYGVVVDYPTNQSLNAIAPAFFGAKKKVEQNTRTWRLFKHREVNAEFLKQGFAFVARRGQFFLPMVLHRMLRCKPISAGAEATCSMLGLTWLWGSPVIVKCTRCTSGHKD